MDKKLTPGQRSHLQLKIGREMKRNPEFAKRVLERNKDKKNSASQLPKKI